MIDDVVLQWFIIYNCCSFTLQLLYCLNLSFIIYASQLSQRTVRSQMLPQNYAEQIMKMERAISDGSVNWTVDFGQVEFLVFHT